MITIIENGVLAMAPSGACDVVKASVCSETLRDEAAVGPAAWVQGEVSASVAYGLT